MATPLVAVVDDDEPVRQSTAALLKKSGIAVEQFASGDAFLATSSPDRFSCILLDLRMPGSDGLSVLRQLGQGISSPPVLVITGHGEVEAAVEAMKLGAHDFLEKPYAPHDLLKAIDAATAKGRETLEAQAIREKASALVASLTERQIQVLHGIVKGNMNKIIAHELGLSVRTVEAYRSELLDKLGVRGTAEAVRVALAAGMPES